MKMPKRSQEKISVITPSYNQAAYINQTIRSVLTQSYRKVQYFILDNCSTDGTRKILQTYKSRISIIIEKDGGQSQAINRGLKKADGGIVGFINSDDYLEARALERVMDYFRSNPDAMWVTGKCKVVDADNREVRRGITMYKNFFLKHLRYFPVFCVVQFISQPATFWRKRIHNQIGWFDESLAYDMDYDFWLRLWSKYPLHYIDEYLACYRVHPESKAVSSPETQFRVEHTIAKRHIKSKVLLFFHFVHIALALWFYQTFWTKSRS